MTESFDTQSKTKKVAPEGGWGYMVAIGLALLIACTSGSTSSFGLVFKDFLAELGNETSSFAIINGVYATAMSFCGLFSSILYKKYSMRSVGLFGAAIYCLGNFLTIFVTSVIMMVFSYGLLQGVGFGLMAPVCYGTFNQYFVKKRVFMMSLTSVLKGIIITIYPILIGVLMEIYGFRGTVSILFALNAHVVFGLLLMHPIELHYKVVQIPEVELNPLMEKKTEENKKNVDSICDIKMAQSHTAIEKTDLLNYSSDEHCVDIRTESISNRTLKRSESFGDENDEDDPVSVRKRIASTASLSDLGGDIFLATTPENENNGIWRMMINLFDLSLLKDPLYINIVVGVTFVSFAEVMFISLLPMYLSSLDYSLEDSALILSIIMGTDMISRIGLTFVSALLQINPRYILLTGAITTIICRAVFMNVFNFGAMVVIVIIIGICRPLIHVPYSLVFADYLPADRFSSGFGLFLFIYGNFSFLMGPVVGWIRDTTHSYFILFQCLQLMSLFCVVSWIIEIVWCRVYKKNSDN